MSIRLHVTSRIVAAVTAIASLTGIGLAVAPGAVAAMSPRSWYGLPTTMTMAVPQVYAGVPVTFTATLSNTVVTGGVQFWANDPAYGLGPIVRAANGTASFTWMPGSNGVNQWQTFGATFWPDINQGTSDATAATVTMRVLPNKGADLLTMSPTVFTLGRGLSQSIVVRSASGAIPAVIAQGGCSLTGDTLTATSPSGTCSIFASSQGANGYLPGSSSWAIPLGTGTQVARLTAPPSGNIVKGSSVRLGSANQSTSTGERITWRISSVSSSCSVVVSQGAVMLRTNYSGACTAIATAPAKLPEYRAFSASRHYRVLIAH